MPYQWTAERERLMLLLAVSSCNLKPSSETWKAVSDLLGEGLTSSAVSQKYYKLRKESVKLCNGNSVLTPPTTPAKRKREDDVKVKLETPTKRMKMPMPLAHEENLDGELCSDFSSSPSQTDMSMYNPYQIPFVPEHFSHYGMEQLAQRPEDMSSNDFSFGSGHNTI